MDWGILSGLGEGLQNIGNTLFSAELSKKLEEDRYQREMSKYDPSQDKYEQIDTDGGPLWHKVRYNKAGDVIDRTLAPKNVIDEMTAAQEDRALSSRLKKAQVANTEYTGARAKVEDAREDEDWGRLTPEEKRREARIKAGLEVSAGQQLTADTSIKGAVLRGSGKNSDSEEGIDFISTAKDFAAQEPDAFRQIADMFGTSDSGTYSRLAGVLQFLLKEMPDRKPSASDVIAAAQALKAKYKIKDSNSAPTGVQVKRPSITG